MTSPTLAHLRSALNSLSAWWKGLGRRRQLALAGVTVAVALGVATGAAVLVSGGGPSRCNEPVCVEVIGPKGDKVHPMTPIQIRVAGSIDRAAALRALQISNEPKGTKTFEGDILTFRPEWPGFARGENYQVVLALPSSVLPPGASAEPVTFSFTTDGKLEVSYVFPPDGAREVALDASLMVQFNRSVAPLTVIDQRGPEGILQFSPPVEGEGHWLNTSLYTFRAGGEGWAPATTYTVTIEAGLANQLGGRLENDYTFSFQTVSPAVSSVSPSNNSTFVAPRPDITVRFNQPVDRASAEAAFVLAPPDGLAIQGTYQWTDDRTFVFTPAQPLPLGTTLQATVRAGVRARAGQAAMATDYSWTFTTVGIPRVTQTDPPNGSQNAPIGYARITFSNPMNQESVEDNISISPTSKDDLYFFWDPSQLTVSVYYRGEPSTAYRLNLSTAAQDRYGQPLAEPLDLNFVTSRLEPYFWLSQSYGAGTFNAYLEPKIVVSSTNVQHLQFRLLRIERSDFISIDAHGIPYPFHPSGELVRQWSETIVDPPLNATVTTTTSLAAEGASLPEGTYLLEVSSPETRQNDTWLPILVSSANVVTKWTHNDVLAWIVDLNTGQPLSNLPVKLLNESASPVAAGLTDGNGLVRLGTPPTEDTLNYLYSVSGYYISAETDGRVVFSGTSWNDGIWPWNLVPDADFRFQPPTLVGYLYTDRPIYRPGETVYLKGIIRTDDDARYSLPQASDLTMIIGTDQGTQVDSRPVSLSASGTFDTSLSLSPEAPTGVYYVEVYQGTPAEVAAMYEKQYVPPVTSVSFRVAEFRKPEFQVQVTTDKDDYTNGEPIQATVAADLFFGQPLAGADVVWKVTAEPYHLRPAEFPYFSFDDSGQLFEFRQGPLFESEQFVRGQGTGKTDAQGRFAFTVPADVSSDKQSQTFTIEATVTDQNEQTVAAFTAVPVHKGQYYAGIRPHTYVATAGAPTLVDLVTIDQKGNRSPNIPVRVTVYLRQWRTVRERDAEGDLTYRSEYEDTLVQTVDVVTDAQAKGAVSITPPQGGQYYVVAEVADALGNTARSSTFLWVSSSAYASWFIGNDDVIDLIADKQEYHPGETANVLVPSPFTESRGLVTLERGRLLDYSLRDFPTNSEVLQIPITTDHIPNIFVSVVLFKPPTSDNPMPQVKFGAVHLKVSNEEKELRISIRPDKTRLEPGQSVVYEIRTTDSQDRGIPAELSLSLVDLSALSLQDDSAQPALEAFWSAHPWGVLTGSTFAISVDRRNELTISRAGAGGAGGKGGGGGSGLITRTFFPNTAYWEPALITDSNGRATVIVTLPDTLTTWRLTARGVTTDTMAGQSKVDIVTAKDVIVRPALPRFLVTGDHALLGAIIHNFTDGPLTLDVSLQATGLDVTGPASRPVTLEAGKDALVRWDTRVRPDADNASVTIAASGAGLGDAVRVDLPVYAFFTPEVVATAGEVRAVGSEAVEVPYYVRPDSGGLTVRVSPSLASGVRTGLVYLDEHPWESAETTVSRFLPRLALRRAAETLGLTDLDLPEGNTDALVRRSLQRIYRNQNQDGGWGWWAEDDSDPAITAYTLIGLGTAKVAGFPVDPQVEEKAAAYLGAQLDMARDVQRPEFDLRAYLLYALALDGRGDLGRSFALAEQRANLSNTAKAWTAIAIKNSGGATDDPRLTALMSDLQSAAIASATGNHWEEAAYDPGTFGNSVQTTAQVLQAFTALQPDHPLVDGTLRWLMVARKEGHWESPHDTAMAIMAITDFMIVRRDVQAAFDYAIAFNGEIRLQGHTERGKVHQEDTVVIPMTDLIKDAINRLDISRSPASALGRLYYTAHLKYFTPAQEIEAANHGIGISHQYFIGDDDTAVRQARLGDIVRVKVTLVAPADLNFLVLEDYLPAGLEPIDASLKTTPLEFRRQLYREEFNAWQIGRPYSPFGHTDIRDNRVALFARFVPKGVYEYTYYAQATTPGEFNTIPATAYEQYFPEVWGRSDGGTFAVTGGEAVATAETGAPALVSAPASPPARPLAMATSASTAGPERGQAASVFGPGAALEERPFFLVTPAPRDNRRSRLLPISQ